MKEVVIKNKIYKLYDCIDELPIINFQKYNKFLLLDSGLGSDIDSVDSHLLNLARLIKTDKNTPPTDIKAAVITGSIFYSPFLLFVLLMLFTV